MVTVKGCGGSWRGAYFLNLVGVLTVAGIIYMSHIPCISQESLFLFVRMWLLCGAALIIMSIQARLKARHLCSGPVPFFFSQSLQTASVTGLWWFLCCQPELLEVLSFVLTWDFWKFVLSFFVPGRGSYASVRCCDYWCSDVDSFICIAFFHYFIQWAGCKGSEMLHKLIVTYITWFSCVSSQFLQFSLQISSASAAFLILT